MAEEIKKGLYGIVTEGQESITVIAISFEEAIKKTQGHVKGEVASISLLGKIDIE